MALAPRYARTVETMAIVRALLNGEAVDHAGEHYQVKIDPPRLATVTGRCPPFYFGGLSPAAREAAALARSLSYVARYREHGAGHHRPHARPRRRARPQRQTRSPRVCRRARNGAQACTTADRCSLTSTSPRVPRSAPSRLITPAMAFTATPNCAKPPPRTTAISSPTYGPASAARARAVVRRSAIPIR